MDPVTMAIIGGVGALKGGFSLKGKGKSRRNALRAAKQQLKDLRTTHQSFEEQAPRQMLALDEAQQGMEGGLANERHRNQEVELSRQRERLLAAIRQAKRIKKGQAHSNRLEALGDIAGIAGNAASGLSSLLAPAPIPAGEQVGAAAGSAVGMANPFPSPFGAMQGAQQGMQMMRRRRLQGLLQNGY